MSRTTAFSLFEKTARRKSATARTPSSELSPIVIHDIDDRVAQAPLTSVRVVLISEDDNDRNQMRCSLRSLSLALP
jgi:hypothetical protein